MAIDGLTLKAAVSELKPLIGGKIDKIMQPEKDELHLIIRSGGVNERVMISASPERCRVQITDVKKNNPIDAYMFCMLMRKHIQGGKITDISQPNSDRVVIFDIESTDELFEQRHYKLIAELMGRHSNIILVDENNVIIDSTSHVGPTMSSVRSVMPGLNYIMPPTAEKKDPCTARENDFFDAINNSPRMSRSLSSLFYGLAPSVAYLLLERMGAESDNSGDYSETELIKFAKEMHEFYSNSVANDKFEPCVVKNADGESGYVCAFIPENADVIRFDTMHLALDYYCKTRDLAEAMRRRTHSLYHSVKLHTERLERRLGAMEEAIRSEKDYEQYRLYGDLITANLYRLKQGQSEAMLENYFDENYGIIKVPLDKRFSPARNAQIYYKRYRKAKSARDLALESRNGIMAELDYMNSQLAAISNVETEADINDITEELTINGYLKQKKDARQKKKTTKNESMHLTFTSSDGFIILVGKNNRQNDRITLKIAAPSDIWLHVKDAPGSHVIIIADDKEVPNSTLVEAAGLAAGYSSVNTSEKVAVDYTQRKNVKKPSGALPGKVIYVQQRTVYVKPIRDIGR